MLRRRQGHRASRESCCWPPTSVMSVGVERVSRAAELHRVRDQFSANQRGAHTDAAHGDGVADGDTC